MPSLDAPSGDNSPAAAIIRDSRRRVLIVSSLLLLWAFAIVILLVLAIYLTCTSYLHHVPLFSSVPIGGGFTQIQAKAIDFAVGAIVAPVVIASANFLWFYVSRMTCLDEKCNGPKAVSLRALAELASTSSGSYNILKHFTLIKTSRLRLVLFSLLVLLSALSSTLLANFVAYEAYHGQPPLRSVVMQSLSTNGGLTRYNVEPDLFLMNMMNTLSYKNATSLLSEDNSYIAANLTDVSIANLSSSVIGLRDVSAYRVTTSCKPAEIDHFNFSAEAWPGVYIAPLITIGDELFVSDIPGNFKDVAKDDPENFYDIVAFRRLSDPSWVVFTPKILLVTATRSGNPRIDTTGSSPSSFGDLPHHSFEVDFGDSAKTKTMMEAWGVVCEVNWQFGTMDMNRNQSTGAWPTSRHSFGEPFVNPFSWLSLSEIPRNWHPPLPDSFGGIGGAIAASAASESEVCGRWSGCTPGERRPGSKRTLNFTTFASNYLYLSAGLDNFISNLDLCQGCIGARDHDVTVQAAFENLAYRITYIPGLLIFALLAIAIAASIPLGMLLYSRDSVVLRTGRALDPLRLVFDCAEALKNGDSLGAVGNWSREKLGKVADKLMVGYHMAHEDCGSRVELSLESSWIGQDSTIWRETGDGASQHLLESVDGSGAESPPL